MNEDRQFPGTWTEAQELRDDLFRRAGTGEMTGEEADAEAERLGLDRLSTTPDPEQFNPKRLTHWTLPMAMAWIAYRDLAIVREWSALYCRECVEWHWRHWRVGADGPIREGWKLEQRPKPTVSLLGIVSVLKQEAGEDAPTVSIREAQEALWTALQEDFFAASGVDQATGLRVAIPALEWHELLLVEGPGSVDEVRRGLLGSGYRDVLVPSVALDGFWKTEISRRERLPPLVTPTGDGYMPLYCAAQWIATEGGTIDFDPGTPVPWRQAFTVLLEALSSDKVKAVGTRDGSREPLPGHHFADCQVEYPFCNPEAEMLWDDTLHLRSYPYLDQESWRRGFDDALLHGFKPRWTRLMVAKEDVRTRWPFSVTGVSSIARFLARLAGAARHRRSPGGWHMGSGDLPGAGEAAA